MALFLDFYVPLTAHGHFRSRQVRVSTKDRDCAPIERDVFLDQS